MAHRRTLLDAIELILENFDRPLTSKEIVDEIRKQEDIEISGDTPANTINARISEDIRENGKDSRFKRVGSKRGRRTLYTLRNKIGKEYEAEPFQKRISLSEDVLVFERALLDKLGYYNGIRKDWENYASILLNAENSFLAQRKPAEDNDVYKQIVSYVIVKYKDSVLRHTRGKITTLNESFLGLHSIGFGGHAKAKDWDFFLQGRAGYEHSVIRELEEEIGINPRDVSPYNFRLIGALNDDSTDLGQHHFAFVCLLELFNPQFAKGEKSVNDLKLIRIPDLDEDFGRYEYWSKMCIQNYFGERLSSDCHINHRSGFVLRDQSEIILLVGLNGSGKTSACTLLSNEFDYVNVPCSQILQEVIGDGPLERKDRFILQEHGYKFINEKGAHERLVQGIVDFMSAHPSSRYALDGLRYPQTLEALRKSLQKPVTVVFLQTTFDSLFLSYREREGRDRSFDDFMKTLNHPVEREVVKFWPIADVVIYHNGSRDSYLKALGGFFQEELG